MIANFPNTADRMLCALQ